MSAFSNYIDTYLYGTESVSKILFKGGGGGNSVDGQ